MKGQVLGHDRAAQAVVIRAENGRRYQLAPSDWLEKGPPRKGDDVDFEPDGRSARRAFRAPAGRGEVIETDSGAAPAQLMLRLGWVRYLLARPVLPAAVLVLLACLVGAYTVEGVRLSLLAAPELAGRLSAAIDDLLASSGTDPAPRLAGALARIATAGLLLLYAVPVLAGIVAWREFVGRPDPRLARLAGIVSAILPLVLPLIVIAIVRLGVMPGLGQGARLGGGGVSAPAEIFQIWRLYAVGTVLLVVSGAALWAAGAGRIVLADAASTAGPGGARPAPAPADDGPAAAFAPARPSRAAEQSPAMTVAGAASGTEEEPALSGGITPRRPDDAPYSAPARSQSPVGGRQRSGEADESLLDLTEQLRLAVSGNEWRARQSEDAIAETERPTDDAVARAGGGPDAGRFRDS